jgi:DNA polymerase III delta prime subunit
MEEKELHHANVIVGTDRRNFIFEILEKKLNFKTIGNPDFLLIENESMGIGDARNFGLWAINKPFLSEIKVSLIIVKSITLEAQNALLKILEEPPIGTYIFINIESLGGILPTFMSRVRVLDLPESADLALSDKGTGTKFLKSDIKAKLSLVNSLSKKADKSDMQELIKSLEEIAYKDNLPSTDLKNILTAKIFASARGSSPKMLLEWLSCVLQ